jgi:hypothetical protein
MFAIGFDLLLHQTRIYLAALTVLFSVTPLSATTEASLFPPEVATEVWIDLKKFAEPSLFQQDRLIGYKSRYRLSIFGINCTAVVIRLDERVNGRITGIVKYRNRCNRQTVRARNLPQDWTFSVAPTKVDELRKATANAEMYEFYPEIWSMADANDICIDGEQLVFERHDERGYRISMANAQCTAPAKLLVVAETFIEIAHASFALKLLH